jgi:hypothetical protein
MSESERTNAQLSSGQQEQAFMQVRATIYVYLFFWLAVKSYRQERQLRPLILPQLLPLFLTLSPNPIQSHMLTVGRRPSYCAGEGAATPTDEALDGCFTLCRDATARIQGYHG